MHDIFRCAFKSLSRKFLRTMLTVSSIAIGVTMVVIVSMISSAGKSAVNHELESLGISGLSISTNSSASPDGVFGLTPDNLQLIRNTANVDTAMPLVIEYGSTNIRDAKSGALFCGIDAGAKQAISLTLKHGRLITKGDVKTSSFVCVVDESLAKKAYGRENITGKTICLEIAGCQEQFQVIGVVEAGSSILQNLGEFIPNMIYVPYSTLQMLTGRENFDQVAVRIASNADIAATENMILDRLERTKNAAGFFRTDNLALQRNKLGNLLDIVSLVLTVISGISIVVSGLGIMTIMLVSVNERTREIGVKKSIGASRGRILFEFLTEAVILSLFGSLMGIAIGLFVSLLGLNIFGIQIPIHWMDFVYLMTFSICIGAVFGVYPAIKASRLKPVDALRVD